MTILFLSRKFYPDVGGVEKHVLELGKRLIKNGNRVIVITESQGKEKQINGIEIFRIKSSNNWFKKFYIWKWLWENRTLISISEIVHAHDVYFWYFPFRFLEISKAYFAKSSFGISISVISSSLRMSILLSIKFMEGIFKSFLIKDWVLFELKKMLKDFKVNESRGFPLFNGISTS